MSDLRFGMIGCGDISVRFFKMMQAIDGAEFVATCAQHLESAKRRGEEYGVAAHYDDYREMMDAENLDGVFVTTPHSVHAEPVLAAFERGLHVLNEKPMATSFAECRQMVDAGEKAGVVFMSLPYDYDSAMVTAQSLIREELIGKITGAEACLNIPGPPRDNWYYDKSIAHGGAMLDCMVYPTGRIVSLLGQAKRVVGFVNTLIPKRIVDGGVQVDSTVDDNVTLLAEYGDGQTAVIRSLWGAAYVENSTTIYGREGSIVLPGNGNVILQRRDGTSPVDGSTPTEWRNWEGCFEVPRIEISEDMTAHFIRCIRQGVEPTCSGRRILHVHEILFKGYEAAEKGETQDLATAYDPWFDLDASLFETHSQYV